MAGYCHLNVKLVGSVLKSNFASPTVGLDCLQSGRCCGPAHGFYYIRFISLGRENTWQPRSHNTPPPHLAHTANNSVESHTQEREIKISYRTMQYS